MLNYSDLCTTSSLSLRQLQDSYSDVNTEHFFLILQLCSDSLYDDFQQMQTLESKWQVCVGREEGRDGLRTISNRTCFVEVSQKGF